MKSTRIILSLVVLAALVVSCSSVRVAADYDRTADFTQYKTFAFYKPGIDKAEISDLDKKRILRSIQNELVSKGYQKSENPDLLVSIFTSEKERISVYNNYGWGWGPYWGPYWGGGYNNVSSSTEGSLYIDLIDAKKKELVWQGKGTGNLITNGDLTKKESRIHEFVQEILSKFPPENGVMATTVTSTN
ncbi:DUF4136 domain-containing protein [Robertkochia solimangrovi]|uniref:DUF4136 domain-containing protein n=1 Tax=Robertkochia solimangrovi TaxID=2213046 RepID=UPI00117C6E1D|nr:DUF4136 domain-containing protein [Robertkochia solimangrovi]TRZ43097.1 DUF4136 domain-containing protein [Robertkochia solimangrovi]